MVGTINHDFQTFFYVTILSKNLLNIYIHMYAVYNIYYIYRHIHALVCETLFTINMYNIFCYFVLFYSTLFLSTISFFSPYTGFTIY